VEDGEKRVKVVRAYHFVGTLLTVIISFWLITHFPLKPLTLAVWGVIVGVIFIVGNLKFKPKKWHFFHNRALTPYVIGLFTVSYLLLVILLKTFLGIDL
jgi:hypothetical protein